MGVGGQRHTPADLFPEKSRYPLYWRLGGSQGWTERVRKISSSPGFDPLTVQPVVSNIPTELYRISPEDNVGRKCTVKEWTYKFVLEIWKEVAHRKTNDIKSLDSVRIMPRSSNVCTSSAILTTLYHFTRKEPLCGGFMSPLTIKPVTST